MVEIKDGSNNEGKILRTGDVWGVTVVGVLEQMFAEVLVAGRTRRRIQVVLATANSSNLYTYNLSAREIRRTGQGGCIRFDERR